MTDRTINHFYAGTGKLLKTVYSTGETWEFGDGGLVYKNGRGGQPQPYQIATPEGRAIYQNGTWQNEFAYTDHLGNTRVSFRANNGQLEKVAETAFDPWGVVLNGLGQTNAFQDRFEMQGKESEKTFGLNRINFGARTYNPTTGRFDRVDPLADKFLQLTTYNFVGNNPARNIDPTGMACVGCGQNGENITPTQSLDGIIGEINYIGDCSTCPKNAKYDDYRNNKSEFTYDSGIVVNGNGMAPIIKGKRNIESNCPTCLDISTIGQNIMGLSYPGGSNPKSYDGDYNYSYVTSDLSEYPAIGHDRRYDNLKTEGLSGLLKDTRAIGADYKFVIEELSIALTPYFSPTQRVHAAGLGLGLGLMALPKALFKLSSPMGFLETSTWYDISNKGVTNTPNKH